MMFRAVLFFFILSFQFSVVQAQCNSFVKKKCIPQLKPYTINGQMNTSNLSAGQGAELVITLYEGQNYRILVCAEEVLGEVSFKLLDNEHTTLVDTKETAHPSYWDFNVKSTQLFIVEVDVPVANPPNKLIPNGCVSVLVGFKNDK